MQDQISQLLRSASEKLEAAVPATPYGSHNITLTSRYEPAQGTLLLEWHVGPYIGSAETVKGANLDSCIHEYLRRKGWTETHAAVAEAPRLTYSPATATSLEDEIPF